MDAELRWSLLQRMAATGRAGDAAIDAQLAADPSDAGRRHAAACRAAIPDAAHKEAAWQLLTGGQAGPETLSAVARGFIQPEHGDLLAAYAGRYLAEIEDIWASQQRSPAGPARRAAVPLPGRLTGTAGHDRGVPGRRAP